MLKESEIQSIQGLKNQGYSQAKAAAELGISRSTVAKYWNVEATVDPGPGSEGDTLKQEKDEVQELKLKVEKEKATQGVSFFSAS